MSEMKFQKLSILLATAVSASLLTLHSSTPSETGKKKESAVFSPARFAELSITDYESSFHVEMLASDDLQGRETGKPGQWLAAKYIANEFSKYGLQPAGVNGKYYQHFRIERRGISKAVFRIEELATNHKRLFNYKTDYRPFAFSGESKITAPVVFVGYGITAPEYGYDDYATIDVKGKIVLVLRHEPQENAPESIFAGTELTDHAYFESKALNARRHGAVGMLLVTDPAGGHTHLGPHGPGVLHSSTNRLPRNWQLQLDEKQRDFPALWVDIDVASQLLAHSRRTLLQLQNNIDSTLAPYSFDIPNFEVHLNLDFRETSRETENVLGVLKGSDPKLRDEVVVIGAHYDHIGVIGGKIHNGADDNASGTAGLLEIAEAFYDLPAKPRRSVLFIAFTAEEVGLLGSEFYVNHPAFPLNKTVAMINLDMIGRNDPNQVSVIGSNRSPELHAINLEANREVGLTLKYNGEQFFHRSDQANFAKHRIPVLFYNTEAHSDYHRPGDVFEKIDSEKISRISRLAFLVALDVANANNRPTYRPFRIRTPVSQP